MKAVWSILFLLVVLQTACAQEISFLEEWGSVFGGREVVLRVRVSGGAQYSGRLLWSLSADQGAILRGQKAIQMSRDETIIEQINFQLPNVKRGVQFDLALSVSLDPGNDPIQRTLSVFHENPFEGRTAWLQSLDLILFDPVGDTGDLFDLNEIPYTRVRQVNALDLQPNQLLIVGEGLFLDEYPQIMTELLAAMSKGCRVIFLAPREGITSFPRSPSISRPLDYLYFQNSESILRMNKGLDPHAWPNAPGTYDRAFAVKSDRNEVVFEVDVSSHTWPLVDTGYIHGGRLIMCAFPVIQRWEDGPTPRHLLRALFENMVAQKKELK